MRNNFSYAGFGITEAHATASFSSRNEHARSRASSMGVGVRGDAAQSACWFRRITHKEDEPGRPITLTPKKFGFDEEQQRIECERRV